MPAAVGGCCVPRFPRFAESLKRCLAERERISVGHADIGQPQGGASFLIYFFSSGGGDFTVCQGSFMGFGVTAHDEPFLACSYCSSTPLAVAFCCAFGSFGSGLWE